jgi:hypothetical protein
MKPLIPIIAALLGLKMISSLLTKSDEVEDTTKTVDPDDEGGISPKGEITPVDITPPEPEPVPVPAVDDVSTGWKEAINELEDRFTNELEGVASAVRANVPPPEPNSERVL